ncbi:MAG: helix-turn-helix transcriptional regulator, MerR family [Paenibacillaceae bacterium]|jgi:DNA-binding transcriptional MerR regulator|nr:helix-turn-helix transcriptional regulator, MerR family [Paenibacillaceae bacterium]
MKYKIGDISKLLGMSTEGLRYYEESGIITPKKVASSKFRYYDVWDLHILVRARAYKRLGFSLREIDDIVNSKKEVKITDMLLEKEKKLEEEVIHSLNLLKRTRQIKEMYADTPGMIYQYRLEHCPGIYRINTQDRYALINDPSVRSLANEWIDKAPFVFSSGLFPREELEAQGMHYHLGFGIEEQYAAYLHVEENQYVKRHPSRLCVHTVLPSSSDTVLSPERLSGAMEYIHSQGLQLAGDAFSMAIDFHKVGQIFKNLHRVWLPVQ